MFHFEPSATSSERLPEKTPTREKKGEKLDLENENHMFKCVHREKINKTKTNKNYLLK